MARKPRSKSDSDMLDSSADMSVEGRLSRIEAEMEDISIVGDSASKEILKLQGRFERLSKDFDEIAEGASAEDLEQVQNSLNEMGERFKAVEDALEAQKNEIAAGVEQNRADLEVLVSNAGAESVSRIENLENSLGERLEALKEEVSQASALVKSEDFENYKLEQSVASEAFGERIKSETAELRNSLENLKNEAVSESAKKIQDLEKSVEEKTARSEADVAELKNSLDTLRESLDGADKAAEQLRAVSGQVESLQNRLNEYAPQFEESVAKAASAKDEIESHLSAIKMAMRLVEQLDERVREIGKSSEAVSAAAAAAVESAPQIAAAVAQAARTSPSAPASSDAEAVSVADDEPIPSPSPEITYGLDELLHVVLENHASDLHIQVGSTPTVRLNGSLVPIGDDKLAENDTKAIIYPVISREQRNLVRKGHEVRFSYATEAGVRFMASAFLERGNVSAHFHLLRTEIQSFEALGLPPILRNFSLYQNGLIVLTGPTGSGKSATMAAMVDYINQNRDCHIFTIEDPIEYHHTKARPLITQCEVGTDAPSFKDALKRAMRDDPDVLVISDVKDAETMMTAITAAEKGYLVIVAMNLPDTVQAVKRMLDTFSGETQRQFRVLLASSLRAVISQKLIARSDGKGRVPAVEVLSADMNVSSMILEDNLEGLAAYLQQGGAEGMQSFSQSVSALYSQGLIAKDDEMYTEEEQVQQFPVESEEAEQVEHAGATLENDTIMNWL